VRGQAHAVAVTSELHAQRYKRLHIAAAADHLNDDVQPDTLRAFLRIRGWWWCEFRLELSRRVQVELRLWRDEERERLAEARIEVDVDTAIVCVRLVMDFVWEGGHGTDMPLGRSLFTRRPC
jgi:hypothetical protein